MTRKRIAPIAAFLVLFTLSAWAADFPISQDPFWQIDWVARAAYNPDNGEYLVVWSAYNFFDPLTFSFVSPTSKQFFGPVMGQLVKEDGTLVGAPFEIFDAGVLPDVVYKPADLVANGAGTPGEYFVVAERWYDTVGQTLDATGKKLTAAPITVLTQARYPRVAYNSIFKEYLVFGEWVVSTPQTLGVWCDSKMYSRQVFSNPGQPAQVSLLTNTIYSHAGNGWPYQTSCGYGQYAIAYAPLEGPDAQYTNENPTPGGRYLLAMGSSPGGLRLLNGYGEVMKTTYANSTWSEDLPFVNSSAVGSAHGMDVTFGYLGESKEPVFFFVWADTANKVLWTDARGKPVTWNGIRASVQPADRTSFHASVTVGSNWWPISWISEHYAYDPYAETWAPRVAYNPALNEFVAAWRETPGPNADTTVNHIRVGTSQGFRIPPKNANIVASAADANANPHFPFIASSKNASVLVGWLDFRWWALGRVFGAAVTVPAP